MSSSYKKEITDYINNVHNQKRPEFSGMDVCPFAAPELANNTLMIARLGEDDKGIIDLLEEFATSDYDSAIIALPHQLGHEDTKPFQIFVNKILKNSSFEDEIKQYGLDDVGLNYKKSKNTVFKRKKTQYNKNVDNLQA